MQADTAAAASRAHRSAREDAMAVFSGYGGNRLLVYAAGKLDSYHCGAGAKGA